MVFNSSCKKEALVRAAGTAPSFSQKNEVWNFQLFSFEGCQRGTVTRSAGYEVLSFWWRNLRTVVFLHRFGSRQSLAIRPWNQHRCFSFYVGIMKISVFNFFVSFAKMTQLWVTVKFRPTLHSRFQRLVEPWLWEHPQAAVRGPPPKPGAEEAGWLSCFRLSSSHLNSFAKLSLASGHPSFLSRGSSVCGPVAVGRSRWWFLPPCHIVVYLSHFVSCSLVRKYAMIILGVRLVLTLRTKCQSWTIPRWTTSAKMTMSYSSWRRDSSISCRCPRTRSKSDQAVNMDVFFAGTWRYSLSCL